MGSVLGKRRFARLGSGVAVGVAIAIALPPTAAQAAPAPKLAVFVPNATAPAQDTEAVSLIAVASTDSQPVELRGLTVLVDAAGLAGVATVRVTVPSGCLTAGAVTRCALGTQRTDGFGLGIVEFAVKAVAGAPLGAKGTLKVTVIAAGFDRVTGTSTVTVGEGVDLVNVGHPELDGTLGGTVALPLSVRNAGETAVHNPVLWVFPEFALAFGKRYRNCEYFVLAARCTFAQDLAPGTAYRTSEPMPLTVRADTRAPHDQSAEFTWRTPADDAAMSARSNFPPSTRGTEPPLELVRDTRKRAADQPDQTDLHPNDNTGFLTVHVAGNNGADLAAVGATVRGTAGQTVIAKLGVINLGPATVDRSRADEVITTGQVLVPAHTTAVSVPDACMPLINGVLDTDHRGKPGAREYRCDSDTFLLVGASTTWEFGLRIDDAAESTGTVRINLKDQGPGFSDDTNAANDIAKILMNPASGGGGGLPVTGSDTVLWGGVGGALLALGGFGYLLGRRRRVRFMAVGPVHRRD